MNPFVEFLKRNELLPCLFFIFSRDKCEKYCKMIQKNLITTEESCLVDKIFNSKLAKYKHLYDDFSVVEEDALMIDKFEQYIIDSDLDIILKGENNYTKFRKSLMLLDSNDISIQSALDILDNYFETIALSQFEKEKQNLMHWLLIEFSNFFDGEEGRFTVASKKDPDIIKALSVLNDPLAFKNLILSQ